MSSFQDYLNKIGKTEEEILISFLPEAQNRIKNFFILREIANKEEIESSEEEIKKEIDKLLKHYPDVKTAKEKLDLEDLEEYTKEAIKNEKVFQLLENSTSHNT